jgi:uncharacterized membrane protein YhaH (DUF805 family)
MEFAIGFAASIGVSLIGLTLQNGLPPGAIRNGAIILLDVLNWWLFLAASVRRMHDLKKTGWLLLFMPLTGFVFLVWWFCLPGREGANRYASPPSV